VTAWLQLLEGTARVALCWGVVILAARGGGWLASKVGQPRVHGEILAGIVLGPSLLGFVWPEAFGFLCPPQVISTLRTVARAGLVLFIFVTGLDLEVDKLRGHGPKAVVISHASILTPIGLAAVLAVWLYPRFGGTVDRTGFILFLGSAMAITALPVLARVLQETGLVHTRPGVLALTCAAVDDITAWCLLAVAVGAVERSGAGAAGRTVVLLLAFVALLFGAVRPGLRRLSRIPLWGAVAFAVLSAAVTDRIGIHAIFGAFAAGVVMPRRPGLRQEVARRLEPVTTRFLLPLFFVVVGLSTRIDLIDSAYLWGVTAVVIAVAVAGKWGGSMVAARLTGEAWRDAATVGILMNTRGVTELIVLTIGLQVGAVTPTLFTVMVMMALVTTLMTTPMLALVAPGRRRLRPSPGAGPGGPATPPPTPIRGSSGR
jgi:Kef-type K+ transport system membrane component KefB